MTPGGHPTDTLPILALDAVGSGEEREYAEDHVATCPRCRQELDALRVVSSSLGHVVAAPPERVWLGIAARLDERREGSAPSQPVTLVAQVRSERAPSDRRHHRAFHTLATVCAAAAVTIALLALNLAASNDQVAHLQRALSAFGQTPIAAALATPGHRVVALRNADGASLAEFVVLPSGTGYLFNSRLGPAPSGKTYELWALVDQTPLPVALLGRSPSGAAFTTASSPRPTALLVTLEPAAGTLHPTSSPLGTAAL